MSLFDFFHRIFGGSNESTPRRSDQFRNEFRNPIWEYDDSDDSDNDFRHGGSFFNFNMYADPIQMHRFFEQQMNEMLKNFNIFESFQDSDSSFDSGFNQFPKIDEPLFGQLQPPAIEERRDSPKNLRDQLLKPEFRRPASEKVDKVLDGKIDPSEIGEALQKPQDQLLIPSGDSQIFSPNRGLFYFSGKSVVSSSVTLPDGTVERKEVIKDSDGTERVTVTRTVRGQEYSVTTLKDASGAEERIENFKNVDPEKMDDFNKIWGDHSSKWSDWWKRF